MNGAVASAGTDHPDEAAQWIAFLTGSPTTVETRLASSWELPGGRRRGGVRQLPRDHAAREPAGRVRRARQHRPAAGDRAPAEMQDIVGQGARSASSATAPTSRRRSTTPPPRSTRLPELSRSPMTSTPHAALRPSLARRSVEIIAANQDAGGAYLASPAFPVYRYSWFRDGAFIADAMSRAGEVASADAFFALVRRVDRRPRRADRRRSSSGRGAASRSPPSEHLPTRFTVDGAEVDDEEWWDFQLDGYGTWMWALDAHRRRHGVDRRRPAAGASSCAPTTSPRSGPSRATTGGRSTPTACTRRRSAHRRRPARRRRRSASGSTSPIERPEPPTTIVELVERKGVDRRAPREVDRPRRRRRRQPDRVLGPVRHRRAGQPGRRGDVPGDRRPSSAPTACTATAPTRSSAAGSGSCSPASSAGTRRSTGRTDGRLAPAGVDARPGRRRRQPARAGDRPQLDPSFIPVWEERWGPVGPAAAVVARDVPHARRRARPARRDRRCR